MTQILTLADLLPAAAEIFLAVAICTVLVVDLFLDDSRRWVTHLLTIAVLGAAAWITSVTTEPVRIVSLFGHYVHDPLSMVLKLVNYVVAAVALLYSREYLEDRGLFRGEYFVLALLAVFGINVMISAGSLLVVYLGIEILSLSLYTLVAFDRDNGIAAESAMKYFILGAIASGALLYGISLVYGVTGTFMLADLAGDLAGAESANIGLILGLSFIVVAIAFKFGAVPFHMWTPDVYHGAPTAVTMLVGSVPKIAAFALAMRVLGEGLAAMTASWQDMLAILAFLSMGLGNLVAIVQPNIKRMLAYSTISHVGFILMGFVAGTAEGYEAALFYTLAYEIIMIGSFGVILVLSRKGFEADQLDHFKGLNQRSPWFAFVMLMLMFANAGVPPMIGFWAKLQVFTAVLNVGMTWLAIAAVVFSVIGAFYYLRVVKLMYFDDAEDLHPIRIRPAFRMVLGANAVLVLLLGIAPGQLLDICAAVIPG